MNAFLCKNCLRSRAVCKLVFCALHVLVLLSRGKHGVEYLPLEAAGTVGAENSRRVQSEGALAMVVDLDGLRP